MLIDNAELQFTLILFLTSMKRGMLNTDISQYAGFIF